MWNTEHAYPSELTQFLPNVCTEAPSGENAFCLQHCATAKSLGRPTKLAEFIKSCGADPLAYNLDGKSKVALVLKHMADAAQSSCEVEDTQNTAYLLRNRKIANETNFSAVKSTSSDCRKDLGDKAVHKLTRSHGVFAGISGGGIIREVSKKKWLNFCVFRTKSPSPSRFLSVIILKDKIYPHFYSWSN